MGYQDDFTLPAELLHQIAAEGFDARPGLIRVLINTAMQIERQQFLGVAPYERSPERRGHGNGYKPETVRTRLGEITINVPQVRPGGSRCAPGRRVARCWPGAPPRGMPDWLVCLKVLW